MVAKVISDGRKSGLGARSGDNNIEISGTGDDLNNQTDYSRAPKIHRKTNSRGQFPYLGHMRCPFQE